MSSTTPNAAAMANARPGVLKTLGVCNIVFAILGGFCIFTSAFVYVMVASMPGPAVANRVEIKVKADRAPTPGGAMSAAFNPFAAMAEPNFLRFQIVQDGWGLLVHGLMLATGIGLLNLRRWAVRWWWNLAWAKMVAVVLLWGYFIVRVIPSLSEAMAQQGMAMLAAQGMPAGRVQINDLVRIYSIMNLFMALFAIVLTSLYPAISLWLLSRPGVKAAIVNPLPQPATEREQP